jgi:muramoyltetrapeptide carboxypeptidase
MQMKTPIPAPILPKKIKPGDTIGIVAPSSPFDPEKFKRGTEIIESFGFNVVVADGIFHRKGYLAGSDGHRAEMVNRFFADTRIDAILCARGGFGAMRILSMLNFESIGNNPKIFMGFSDATAILSALYTRCNLVSFHGPVVASLADGSGPTRRAFEAALTSRSTLNISPRCPETIRSGTVTAPIVGGNLTILSHLLGTPFQPRFDYRILFIEDCNEAMYSIDRKLTHMKLAGCFRNLVGVMLGTFDGCGELAKVHDLVDRALRDVDIPILGGFEIGHGDENISLPLGISACLDTDLKVLTIDLA